MSQVAGNRALRHCVATAHANIALIKYWGKYTDRRGEHQAPATPSIALALAELTTTTSVMRSDGSADVIRLDGTTARGKERARIADYLQLWRERGLLEGCFRIESASNFERASGMASSASGFAALALALGAFVDGGLTAEKLTRLARLGSGSAARSITGGLSALPAGADPAARLLLPAERVPWGMVLCQVAAPRKKTGSRDGMRHTRETSPYYAAWLAQCQRDYDSLLAMLRLTPASEDSRPGSQQRARFNLNTAGPLIEANCLAMHACMLSTSPPLTYWSSATLAVIAAACDWRAEGLPVYFTIDAGAHVFLICEQAQLAQVALLATELSSVQQAIVSAPGGPASILERR
jgi:diphosphomevalonate decarboxylase